MILGDSSVEDSEPVTASPLLAGVDVDRRGRLHGLHADHRLVFVVAKVRHLGAPLGPRIPNHGVGKVRLFSEYKKRK